MAATSSEEPAFPSPPTAMADQAHGVMLTLASGSSECKVSLFSNPETPVVTSAEQFTCFPNLPLELRLKIWRRSFPADREVNLGLMLPENEDEYVTPRPRLCSSTTSPATLLVNRESRLETLRWYTMILECDLCQPHAVYFNPELDTIVLDGDTIYAMSSTHINAIIERAYSFRDTVKSLVYRVPSDFSKWWYFTMDIKYAATGLKAHSGCRPWNIVWYSFQNLERLEFIVDLDHGLSEEENERRYKVFIQTTFRECALDIKKLLANRLEERAFLPVDGPPHLSPNKIPDIIFKFPTTRKYVQREDEVYPADDDQEGDSEG